MKKAKAKQVEPKKSKTPALPNIYLWSGCLVVVILAGILIVAGISSQNNNVPDYMTTKERYVPINEPELQPQQQPTEYNNVIDALSGVFGNYTTFVFFILMVIPTLVIFRAFSRAMR